MNNHEKHRKRFQDRKEELDRRRKYSEYKRHQYKTLSETETSQSAKIDTSEEENEELLEAFLHEMQSISEPGEIDFPEFVDEYHDEVDSEAFTLFWDGGGLNNGGYSVWRVGPYYFCNTEGTLGPFAALKEALEWSMMNTVNSATESIKSSELTADELAKILSTWDDVEQGFQLQINDETWELNWRGTWSRSTGRDGHFMQSTKGEIMGEVITFLKRIPKENLGAIVGRGWGKFRQRQHARFETAQKRKQQSEQQKPSNK